VGALLRFAAVAVLTAAVALLLRRSNPEAQIPLAAAVCCFVLWGALKLLEPVRTLLERAALLSGLSDLYFLPVAKCVVIGIVAKGAADLCRDSGQSAIAGAVELGGSAAALLVSLPLLSALLDFLGKLL
jgi:stage III sporulation protein AD